jgi:BolA family transcriptional regulator, general stress-responsive regulator
MKEKLYKKLTLALQPTTLEIVDESAKHAGHAGARPGGNTHFFISILAEAFTPLSRIERHRLIHEILQEELADTIHALSLDLRSPEETIKNLS